MQNAAQTATPVTPDMACLSAPQLIAMVQSKDARIARLEHHLDWFKRQLFGQKSERFAPLPDPTQMYLSALAALPDTLAPEQHKVVPAHTRRVAARDPAAEADAVPFFDEARVPIETIPMPNTDVADLAADQFEVIGEKVSYRLAQRPGSFVVLKY